MSYPLETKPCQNCKKDFTIEPEDFEFYEKIKVPPPTWCPECRLIRRLAWRNERTFYRRNCDRCKKPLISVFSPETGLTVYCSPCWWSDEWDGLEYGVDFDSTKPFLQQVRGLLQRVPVMNLFSLYTTLINADYTNMVSYLKNCYLVTHSDNDENVLYGSFVDNSKDSVDNLMLDRCELCYECVNCSRCFQTFFSIDCEDCRNVYFSKNCVGCSDCFGCINLRNKRYHIFNRPYSKEEYQEFIKDKLLTRKAIGNSFPKAEEIWQRSPQKYLHGWHNIEVTGDYISNSKNTRNSFVVGNVEDSRFCAFITAVTSGKMTDCYDFTHYGVNSQLLYDSLQVGSQTSNVYFSWFVLTQTHNVEYSMLVVNSHNIFGSVGLKRKEYCILNKQYSKDEYERLRERIIAQMHARPYIDTKGRRYPYGEFWPSELSPFAYNETTGEELFPLLTREEALKQGYQWRKPEVRSYPSTVSSEDLPSQIKHVADSVFEETIGCSHEAKCNEQCTTAFRIIPQELEFYRKLNLPLPRLCPNCRHYRRLRYRNPFKLWHRKCQCAGSTSDKGVYKNTTSHSPHSTIEHCPNEFETSYAPERSEIVYCEACYQSEVV